MMIGLIPIKCGAPGKIGVERELPVSFWLIGQSRRTREELE
jgi:hypothetical protein